MNMYSVVHNENRAKPLFTPTAIGLLQRACACGKHTAAGSGECEECRKKREGTLQRAAMNKASVNQVPPVVHEVLHSPGQSLDAQTRNRMEPRFGHDFSDVRVHTDPKAAKSAQAVNALAYTVGRDLVFGEGQYAPGTRKGLQLLAHELTHVVQQGPLARTGVLQSLSLVGDQNDVAEREADQMAAQVVNGQLLGRKIGQHPPTVMRATEETLIDTVEEAVQDVGEFARGAVRWLQCTLGGLENPVVTPLSDMSTFQSPGGSGWWWIRLVGRKVWLLS
jgi:hypothetical protein